MKICFLFALEHEAKTILTEAKTLSQERLGYAQVYRLEYQGKEFFACITGVGKVLAGSGVAACCVAHPEIDAFVNLGVGGSLDATKAPLLSAVLAKDFVQHDMNTTAFGDPRGYLWGIDKIRIDADEKINGLLQQICDKNGVNYSSGTMASGDLFVAQEKQKSNIVERFDALMIDMEAAAFAESCYVYHKPFTALRIVSDAVDHDKEYEMYKIPAGKKACELGLAMLALC